MTNFWELFKVTREIDPATGQSESERRWARRANVDVNVLRGWQKGATPKLATLRRIAAAMKVKKEDYYEWARSIEAAEEIAQAPMPEVPLYSENIRMTEEGEIIGNQIGFVTIAPEVLIETGVDIDQVIAIRLSDNTESMEPEIPRNSTVFINVGRGRDMATYINGGIYALVVNGNDKVTVCWLVSIHSEHWCAYAHTDHPPLLISPKNPQELIVGEVFHFRASPMRINPRFFKPEKSNVDSG
jgi:hypothetical protein